MMKVTVHRKHNLIKVFSKSETLHSDAYWEDHSSQNSVLLLEDHAHLTIGSETRERLLLLSTDSLIIAKAKSLYLKLKVRVNLSDIWFASCTHRVTSRKFNSKTSFVIGWPTTNYVVTLSSSQTKDKWLCALQWHSVRARQCLIPNRIILTVQLFDSAVTTAVNVDVHSTSEIVVQSVIQENSLVGGVSDYQLCVLYDGEEEIYPLIGHELPYCILLHSLRGQRSRHMLGRQQWHSADELRVTKDTNELTAPRFILKNQAAKQTYDHAGSLKHKRKKSLIGWALRKGHTQTEGHTDLQPTSNKLFGQSLALVCHDGHLPQPILELLCVLYHEGPGTLGIFRRSANAKSCRILKEKLNFGHRVSFRGESVFVAASLLTEFLRKLPGSIMGCDLYEDWMNVMEVDDQQCRCSSVKSVLAKLPQVNRTLLCYVFGVLHRIHTHSDVNQMTASNLALCIAPNMLWRATTSNPEQESQSTLKVAALVCFLIENTPSIFGDDAEKTFTTLLKSVQESDDRMASLPFHSSSEETDLDFLPSPLFSPDIEPFLPLSTLSLSGNRKLHTSKVVTETTDDVYSYGTLDLASTQSSSLGDFGQARDRCLSEPSMCFDATTPPQTPPHPPVIRQSSCDNAIMDNKISQSQSPALQSRSRGAGKGRYAFWKSPPFPARFRHPAQRLASMSSLSSTTTSSLSSLDSFEYIPSPSDDKPRPFLFGTSARLRPLTPEMPRKLWTMAFAYDEIKDGNSNGEMNEEKEGGVHGLEDEHKVKDGRKDEEDGEAKVDSSGVMEEREEHETAQHDEGISRHLLLSNEDRDLGILHTLSHTHPCPVHTKHTHTLHTHSLTLLSKQDKTSRMKITLFPRMGKQSRRVTMETGGEAVTVGQVNVPQTLFYKQNVNLVLQSEGRQCKTSDTGDVCACNDSCISKATEDKASHGLSINTTKNGSSLSGSGTAIQSGVSNISDSNQSEASVSEHRISINTSASTDHKVSINVNDSVQTGPGNGTSAPATTDYAVSISSTGCHSDSQNASTSISHTVSVSKISHSVSISPSNANHYADASTKSSIRQAIRIRLPANVRNSVRAYFSPAHTLTHACSRSVTQTHSAMPSHSQPRTHTLPKSQNRPLFTSKLQ